MEIWALSSIQGESQSLTSKSNIVILLVGENSERRLNKNDKQFQERTLTSSLGFTEVRGTDGKSTILSDISPAMSEMAQKTMLT
jgi:hypothetical protein